MQNILVSPYSFLPTNFPLFSFNFKCQCLFYVCVREGGVRVDQTTAKSSDSTESLKNQIPALSLSFISLSSSLLNRPLSPGDPYHGRGAKKGEQAMTVLPVFDRDLVLSKYNVSSSAYGGDEGGHFYHPLPCTSLYDHDTCDLLHENLW